MKVCPVCGAGAFDDAEVCFGCLHRYESLVPQDEGRLAAAATPMKSMSSAAPRSWPESGLYPSKPSVTEKLQEPSGAAYRRVPAMREAPLEAEAVVEPSLPSSSSVGAGWVVRFEFPGFAPMDEGCGLLRGGVTKGDSPSDLVVRLQPITSTGVVERRRGRPSRGSHVRAPDKEGAAAALPERI